jgi:RNA polymerase sigma-70 factor (ECF subfamily)
MPRLTEVTLSAETVSAARSGDERARRELFDRVAPGVFALALRIVKQRALAEDLLQDTLIAMYEHLADFRGEAPFGAWVQRIAVSRSLMALRSPWHRARIALESFADPDDVLPPTHDGRLGDLVDAERALANLTPQARAVVWLYEVEGWSHEEIAAAFGKTVSFSKSQLARALARITAPAEPPARRVPATML